FTRASLKETLYKSPFEGLSKHSEITKQGISELKKAIKLYVRGDFEEAQKRFKRVSKIEHDADKVKMNTWENLPRSIFMPVKRDDFMALLKEADSILDNAEDVGVLLPMREEPIPKPVHDGFREFADKIFNTAKKYEEIMNIFKEVIDSSFSSKSKDRIRELHEDICQLEYEADVLEERISKKLFNMDDKPLTAVHLLKVLDRMDSIADHAENVADKLVSILETR
ncbi:MAG: TIGR00153 family protein, partial [Candidatus Saliniplasma sp.]